MTSGSNSQNPEETPAPVFHSVRLEHFTEEVLSAHGPDSTHRQISGAPWPDLALRPGALRRAAPPVVGAIQRIALQWHRFTGRRLRLRMAVSHAGAEVLKLRSMWDRWVEAGQPDPSRVGGRFQRSTMHYEHAEIINKGFMQAGFAVQLDPVAMCRRPSDYEVLNVLMMSEGFGVNNAAAELGAPGADTWTWIQPFHPLLNALSRAYQIACKRAIGMDRLGDVARLPVPSRTLAELLGYLTGTHTAGDKTWGLCWARWLLATGGNVPDDLLFGIDSPRARQALVKNISGWAIPQLDSIPTKRVSAGLLLAMMNQRGIGLDWMAQLNRRLPDLGAIPDTDTDTDTAEE